ncbi:MAG: hypothetical protein J6Y42_05035 [Bacilli bacterium]|nr:hypothetical protein [Bacilli bacterium]
MNIELVRGEEFPIEFTLKNDEDVNMTPQELTDIVITCRKLPYSDSDILFQKKLSDSEIRYTDGTYTFNILEEDTKDLNYGTYGYDIKVIQEGLIDKFIGSIIIKEEYNCEYED